MGEVTLLRLGGFGQVMAAIDLGGDVLRHQPGVRGVREHRAHQFLQSACNRDVTNGEVAAHSGHLPAVIRVPPVGLEPTLDGF